MNRKVNISVALMLTAIVAILLFQIYWLYKNFREEKENLRIRTNVMFRESIQQCQLARLRLDSNMRFRVPNEYDAVGMVNALKDKIRDTLIRRSPQDSRVIISIERKEPIDSAHILRRDSTFLLTKQRMPPGERAFIRILEEVNEGDDSIGVDEISKKLADLMSREKTVIPFSIVVSPGLRDEERFPPKLETANSVTLGIRSPKTFTLNLNNTVPYLLGKLSGQILVSVLLIGLTILSFYLLYRNMMQQRRLTQLKNDFISNITHELKTPIATVSVAIEALKNFNAMQDPRRTAEYLDISGNELQRLSLLVDKVLKLSMFEKQQIELKPELFDMKSVINEVTGSMKLQIEKHHAILNIEEDGTDFSIRGDRLHITSVLYNLIDNAIKYSKSNPVIEIGLKDMNDHLELSVTDNGIGIPADLQKKIFDKFFRVPVGDMHNVKGYGLGLSYVAFVVAQHGGTVDIESTPGIGSRFTVKLPKQYVQN